MSALAQRLAEAGDGRGVAEGGAVLPREGDARHALAREHGGHAGEAGGRVLAASTLGSLAGTFEPGGGSLNRTLWTPGFPDQAQRYGEGSNYAAYIEDQFRPTTNWSVRVGMRVEQENIRADGFEHFDPATEASQFDAGYTACVGSSSDTATQSRCARANFHFFHTFESFPVLGGSSIRQYVEDPTVALQRRIPETFRISNTSLAPRLSVSWDPGTDGKTKIFGTAGRYYGETFLAVPLFEQPPTAFNVVYDVDPLRVDTPNPNGDGTITTFIPVIEPDTQADVQPATVYQVDRNLRPAYQDEYTLGFQREIFQETSVTFTYIRRYFRDLFQDVDANHFARDFGTVTANSGCFRPRPQAALQPIDRRKDGIFDDCGGRVAIVPGPRPSSHPGASRFPTECRTCSSTIPSSIRSSAWATTTSPTTRPTRSS